MSDRTTWIFDRQEATGTTGVVASKHRLAAEAGAAVLRRGGNAVDAAVTTAFTVGVVEPFMSGLGGGGLMVANLPDRGGPVVVDYSMVAPHRATPDMYKIVGGTDQGLFGWPAVENGENMTGYRSVAVPGTVAGLALALERYGTISLREAMEPAIRYAEEGFPVTWHTTYFVAYGLAGLNRFPASRAIFTNNGMPPLSVLVEPARLVQSDLARTLRAISEEGPRAFYEGATARRIAADMRANNGLIDEEDFRSYKARVVEPLRGTYRGVEVLAAPTATGGPTILEMLNLMEGADLGRLGHNSVASLHEIAESARQAFVDRFAYLADPDSVDVPVERLISKEYASERCKEFDPNRARDVVRAGDRDRLGVRHTLGVSEPGYGSGHGTTTHIAVIDRDGNAVSITQTLLSGWGSSVVIPGTGVLLNDGMMWFDPEPGKPNSIAAGKLPLANMAPAVLLRDGKSFMALGAMGGRRILTTIPQIISNVVDHGMGIQAAITAPRIDYATRDLQISDRIPSETIESLRKLGHPVLPREEDVVSIDFASPVGVLASDGKIRGGANPYYPAMAVGV